MSKTTKTILAIAILVVVFGCAYAYMNKTRPAVQTSPEEVTTLPSGTDTGDAALDTDMQAIDDQLKGVADDNANVSASVQSAAAQ